MSEVFPQPTGPVNSIPLFKSSPWFSQLSQTYGYENFCTEDGTFDGTGLPKTQTCTYSSDIFIDDIQRQDYWIPQSTDQTKTLRYQVHFVQKSDSSGNWQDIPNTHSRWNQINDWLNNFYLYVDDHSMNIPGVADINEAYLQFELVDLHFYQDDAIIPPIFKTAFLQK